MGDAVSWEGLLTSFEIGYAATKGTKKEEQKVRRAEGEKQSCSSCSSCQKSLFSHVLGVAWATKMEQLSLLDKNTALQLKLSQLELRVATIEQENQALRQECDRLAAHNRALQELLDAARQTGFVPTYCRCGCGKIVVQNSTGRRKHYFSNAYRQRHYRSKKRNEK